MFSQILMDLGRTQIYKNKGKLDIIKQFDLYEMLIGWVLFTLNAMRP